MEESDWNNIKLRHTELVKDLETERLLDQLVQDDVLHGDDYERIRAKTTQHDKNKGLLDILKTKRGSYKYFYEALKTSQPWLVDQLETPSQNTGTDFVKYVKTQYILQSDCGKITLQDIKERLPCHPKEQWTSKPLQNLIKQAFFGVQFVKKRKSRKYRLNNTVVKHLAEIRSIDSESQEHTSTSNTETRDCHVDIGKLDVNGLYAFLTTWSQQNGVKSDFCEVIRSQDIDGEVLKRWTEDDLQKYFPTLLLGPRMKLLFLLSKSNEVVKEERAKKFDQTEETPSTYTQHSVIRHTEDRITNLIEPVHKFVGAQERTENQVLKMIGSQTVEFAAACINCRSNGTIHFGIKEENCEVIGINVDENTCRQSIQRSLEERFSPNQISVVKQIVRPARCIKVINISIAGPTLYVIEVDIVPSFSLVAEDLFFVKKRQGKKENVFVMNEREIKVCKDDQLRDHKDLIGKLSKERQQREEEHRMKKRSSPDVDYKFRQLFCGGSDSLDGDLYHLLVCGKPGSNFREFVNHENFQFLKLIKWMSIMDMADNGGENSLFQIYEQQCARTASVFTVDELLKDNADEETKVESVLNDCTLPPWIFLNGYHETGEATLSPTEWKDNRSAHCKRILGVFEKDIPKDRAVIVILLLSDDEDSTKILVEICNDICEKFKDQWIVVSHSSTAAEHLKAQLIQRCIKEETLAQRFVVGIRWGHLNETIKQLAGHTCETELRLSTSTGACCVMPEKKRSRLTDIEILGQNECEGIVEKHMLDDQSSKEEIRFYRGDEASWWNYWFKEHVCERNQTDMLFTQVHSALQGDLEENDRVGRVYLYHQPGSGGTTLGKNIVWMFRNHYRCCTVTRITGQTSEQIAQLRNFEENGSPKPVLVFLDNMEDEQIVQLHGELEEIGRKSDSGIFCVLLVCSRKPLPGRKYEGKRVWLTHKLQPAERKWFNDKYCILEKKHSDKTGVDPSTLLAFNIMKKGFNTDYIKETITRFVLGVTSDGERSLLKYLSFINWFDPDFQYIPLSCFDNIMSAVNTRGFKWETKMSEISNNLIVQKSLKSHNGQGIRIFNNLACKEMFSALSTANDQEKKQTVSEIMLELLDSGVLSNRGYIHERILTVIKNLVKKRAWTGEEGTRKEREKFAPLVGDICINEGKTVALEIMDIVFKKTNDAMIAQSIARFYIETENWNKAKEYAKISIHILPKNSYLLDTYGQIYRRQLEAKKTKQKEICTPTQADLSTIDDALTGIGIFQDGQEVARTEPHFGVPNTAGYIGEVQLSILLMDFISLLKPFDDIKIIRAFMVNADFIPDGVEVFQKDRCTRLKHVYRSSQKALLTLEERYLHFKDGAVDDYQRDEKNGEQKHLIKLKEHHDVYFTEDPGEKIPTDLSPEDKAEYRRRIAQRLVGLSLGKTLDVRQDKDRGAHKLSRVYGLLLDNIVRSQSTTYDFMVIIRVVLALSNSQPVQRVCEVGDVIEWSTNLSDLIPTDTRQTIELEPYLYKVMFHWPLEDDDDNSRVPCEVLEKMIDKWRVAFQLKYPQDRQFFQRKLTTLFFLGKGTGMSRYMHFKKLHGNTEGRRAIKGAQIWENPDTIAALRVQSGTLINQGGDVQMRLNSSGNITRIKIPCGPPIKNKSMWNKPVFFFLGFSWSGPKAYGVTDENPDTQVPAN